MQGRHSVIVVFLSRYPLLLHAANSHSAQDSVPTPLDLGPPVISLHLQLLDRHPLCRAGLPTKHRPTATTTGSRERLVAGVAAAIRADAARGAVWAAATTMSRCHAAQRGEDGLEERAQGREIGTGDARGELDHGPGPAVDVAPGEIVLDVEEFDAHDGEDASTGNS